MCKNMRKKVGFWALVFVEITLIGAEKWKKSGVMMAIFLANVQ